MKRASISEAKNRLSALIDRVRHGDTVVIEDRGVPVARLEPVARSNEDDTGRLARLERQGVLRRPTRPAPIALLRKPGARPTGRVRISDVLLAERREGR